MKKDKQVHELFADLRIRFTSGNKIQVERAHITATEFKLLAQGFANWTAARERYHGEEL